MGDVRPLAVLMTPAPPAFLPFDLLSKDGTRQGALLVRRFDACLLARFVLRGWSEKAPCSADTLSA